METNQLIQTLKKHPNAYIYYTDHDEFIVYTSKKDFNREYHGEGNFEDYEIFKTGDRAGFTGYVPVLVEALATISGFDVGSV